MQCEINNVRANNTYKALILPTYTLVRHIDKITELYG